MPALAGYTPTRLTNWFALGQRIRVREGDSAENYTFPEASTELSVLENPARVDSEVPALDESEAMEECPRRAASGDSNSLSDTVTAPFAFIRDLAHQMICSPAQTLVIAERLFRTFR